MLDVKCSHMVIAAAVFATMSDGYAGDRETGALQGVIRFNGKLPARKFLYPPGDPAIRLPACQMSGIVDESLVVNPESKGIADVFIYLKRKPEGFRGPVPKTSVLLAPRDCRFLQRASLVRVGQTVEIQNPSPFALGVHFFPLRVENPAGTKLIPIGGKDSITYKRSEILPVAVSDDLNPWLRAYHLVLDHPFAAVTDKNGKFGIKGLPPGKYRLIIWQERSGYLETNKGIEVEIKAKSTTRLERSYDANRFK